jgi:hypothetical protein
MAKNSGAKKPAQTAPLRKRHGTKGNFKKLPSDCILKPIMGDTGITWHKHQLCQGEQPPVITGIREKDLAAMIEYRKRVFGYITKSHAYQHRNHKPKTIFDLLAPKYGWKHPTAAVSAIQASLATGFKIKL